MEDKKSFKIDYHTLSEGKHNISFSIDTEMFSAMNNGVIHGGECVIDIDLTKSLSLLRLDVKINGIVIVDCDRCLEELPLPIRFDGVLFVKITNSIEGSEFLIDDKTEDTMLLNPLVEELDITDYIFDSVMLALPLQRIHPEDEEGESGCNSDMLSRFTIVDDSDWDDDDDDDDDFDDDDEEDEDEVKAEGGNKGDKK